jgi:fermentation-respiration switch protein FrsA (DUF1100 family)
MRRRPASPEAVPRARRAGGSAALAVTLAAGLLSGCSSAQAGKTEERTAATSGQSALAAAPKLPALSAPTRSFAVGVRTMTTTRNGRQLKVTIWYPSRGTAGGDPTSGATVATGKFPVVMFSHGLNGAPADYQTLETRWVAAGFVVAAPAYPNTTRGAKSFNVLDVINQPADASYVLSALLALNGTAGDPLRGHLDTQRVGAAGHSAGGITTVGLFTINRDKRLRAGIVLAGNALGVGTAFAGPAAPLLFVHGDNDPLVSYASGKDAYNKDPWPRAFLTMPGENHGDPYLTPSDPAFKVVATTTTDFLRWSLYGDAAAKKRLTRDATTGRLGTLDNKL